MFLSRRKLSTCPFPNIQHSTLLLINNQWKNVIVPNVRNEQETARVGVIKDFKCSCKINWIEKKHLQIRSYHYLDISNVWGFFLISHSWPGLVFVLSCSALGWAVGLSRASARCNSKYHHSSILIISCCTGLVG